MEDRSDTPSHLRPGASSAALTDPALTGSPAPAAPAGRLDRKLVALLAVAVGVSVANLYYIQPLLPMLRRSFGVSAGVAALSTTLTQLGYVAGLALILPLGDLVERRRLACLLALACAGALVLAAVAPDLTVLLVAVLLVGATAVLAQALVPYAATLAPAHERGRVVGIVMSGLLIGILLARTFAGLLGGATSWRVVLVVAAVGMCGVAVALRLRLPRSISGLDSSYGELLASLVTLFREEPVLRRRAGYGALSMASFSVLWTSIAFLLAGSPYHEDSARIGLFGLVGAAGALMASAAGRYADKGRARQLTVFAAACIAAAFVPIWLGAHHLVALIIGIVVLDVGCQGMQITNQSQIYALRPEARTRLNAVYMTVFFLGGAAGSACSALLYATDGWAGVCLLGLGLGTTSLAVSIIGFTRGRARAHPPEPGLATP